MSREINVREFILAASGKIEKDIKPAPYESDPYNDRSSDERSFYQKKVYDSHLGFQFLS